MLHCFAKSTSPNCVLAYCFRVAKVVQVRDRRGFMNDTAIFTDYRQQESVLTFFQVDNVEKAKFKKNLPESLTLVRTKLKSKTNDD